MTATMTETRPTAGTSERPPVQSLEQRLDALKEANRIRTWRKNMKADIAAGRRTVAGLIADPPQEILTMKLIDLLLATPKVGRVRIRNLFRSLDVSPSKTIGGLSERQRAGLCESIRGNYVPIYGAWRRPDDDAPGGGGMRAGPR